MNYKVLEENIDTKKLEEELDDIFWDKENTWLQDNSGNYNFNLEYTNSLLEKLGMFNSRVMLLQPTKCYSYHTDTTPRIHIPVTTNNFCFFILKKEMFNLPEGKAYWIDTRKAHTALNGCPPDVDFDRWHIVGMTNEAF